MNGRRILALVAGAAALLAGLLAAVALLIPSERVAAAVAARAETLLGQRVTIQDVGFRLFPVPGVRLDGITVGGTAAGDTAGIDNGHPAGTAAGAVPEAVVEPPLAMVDGLDIRARILPLFRGEVVVHRITLDGPRVFVRVDSAGNTNFPVLEADSVPADTAASARRDIRFSIQRLTVDGGHIEYRDARDGSRLVLDGWDQELQLEGDTRGGDLERVHLSGHLAFARADGDLARVILPVRDLQVEIRHDATFLREAERLELGELRVALGDVTLEGSGTLEGLLSPDRRYARLGLAARGLDVATLASLLPDSARSRLALPDGRRLDPVGTADLRVDVDGPARPGALPGFQGVLTLEGAGASSEGVTLAEAVRGRADFSADSTTIELQGRLLGDGFTARLEAREPESPVLRLALKTSADLARLQAAGLTPDSMDLAGRVQMDVTGILATGRPEASDLSGAVLLDRVRLDRPDMPLQVTDGALTLDGQRLSVDRLDLLAGDTAALSIAGTADGWIPALLDSLAPPITLDARVDAGVLDLDALLGPSESEYPALLFARLQDRPLDTGTADESAEAAGLSLPALPPVNGEVRFRADRILRNGLAYSDLDALLRFRPETVEVVEATFGFMGGRVRATGLYEPTEADSTGTPVRARLVGQFALEDVGARTFFQRLTPLREHIAGDFDMAGSVRMDLDRLALPERTTLGGDGNLAFSEGRLANWPLLEALGERLGLTALDTVYFRDWIGAFQVTGSRIMLQETALEGENLSARVAGAFGFAGDLDLGATVYLPRELAQRAGGIGGQVLAAAGTDGRIPVGVTVGGTARRPDVSIDLSEARENVVTRAREEARREARELAEQGARAAAERLELPDSLQGLPTDSLRQVLGDSAFGMLPDSLRIPRDSLRARAEDEIRDRLRRIFP